MSVVITMKIILKKDKKTVTASGDGVFLSVMLNKEEVILDLAGSNIKDNNIVEQLLWVKGCKLRPGSRIIIIIAEDSEGISEPIQRNVVVRKSKDGSKSDTP